MARDDADLRQYQDDLDTNDDVTDPVMEENDNVTEALQVPADEPQEELESIDFGAADAAMRDDEDQNLKDRW